MRKFYIFKKKTYDSTFAGINMGVILRLPSDVLVSICLFIGFGAVGGGCDLLIMVSCSTLTFKLWSLIDTSLDTILVSSTPFTWFGTGLMVSSNKSQLSRIVRFPESFMFSADCP